MIELENFDFSKKYIVGVSGGADSMCLLYLLKNKANIIVAHVNHNIRYDSILDENLVKKFCYENNIPFRVKRLTNPPKSGIEEWGRNCRYDFFNQLISEYNADYILTAHNANDQAETVIMRLMRGTGIKGLQGIHKNINNIIRPLLHVKKEDIYNFCRINNIPFREDFTNTDTKYLRNKVRHQIIKTLCVDVDKLCFIAKKANDIYPKLLNKLKNQYNDKYKKTNNMLILSKEIILNDFTFILLYDLLYDWVKLSEKTFEKICSNDSKNNVVCLGNNVICDKRSKRYIKFFKS